MRLSSGMPGISSSSADGGRGPGQTAMAWGHHIVRARPADVSETRLCACQRSVILIPGLTRIEPELWVDGASAAVAFYEAAFGAVTLHRVGVEDDIVVQLAVGDARFWVTAADASAQRFSPTAIQGATGRTLLVVEDPEAMLRRAVRAGARELAPVRPEHGWLLGRIVDPFGHEWEIGTPTGPWPPG